MSNLILPIVNGSVATWESLNKVDFIIHYRDLFFRSLKIEGSYNPCLDTMAYMEELQPEWVEEAES